MQIKVYGVEFPSLSAFFRRLGYAQSMGPAQIKKKYGTLEKLCEVRLHTKDPAKIKAVLERGYQDPALPGLGMVAKMSVRRCLSSATEEQTIIECATLAGVAVDAEGMKAIKAAISAYQMSLDPADLNI